MKLWELMIGTGVKGRSMAEVIVVDGEEIDIRESKEVLWSTGSLGELDGCEDRDHNNYLRGLFDSFDDFEYSGYSELLLKDVCVSEIELIGENKFKFIVDCYG